MTNQTFDLNKCERNVDGHYLCRTRSGLDAKVVYVLECNTHPLMVVVNRDRGVEDMHCMTKDGTYARYSSSHPLDIVNIPRTIKVERWMNVREDGETCTWKTREDADKYAPETAGCPTRIACKHIVFEVEEGEGL